MTFIQFYDFLIERRILAEMLVWSAAKRTYRKSDGSRQERQTSQLVAIIGVDTIENEHLDVLRGFNLMQPYRPSRPQLSARVPGRAFPNTDRARQARWPRRRSASSSLRRRGSRPPRTRGKITCPGSSRIRFRHPQIGESQVRFRIDREKQIKICQTL